MPNTTITTNLVGQKVGQYHLISRVGENKFFTVYKAYYPGAYDYVAVKILHDPLLMSVGFTDHFQNLPNVLAELDHPSISQLYDYGRQDEIFYLITEFIDGVSLAAELEARRLQQQSFTLAELNYILQIVERAIDDANHDWQADFQESIVALNPELMAEHIDRIRDQNEWLANTLTGMINNFEYDRILALLQDAKRKW